MLLSAAHGRVALGCARDTDIAGADELAALGLDPAALEDPDRRLLGLLATVDGRLEVERLGGAPVWLAALRDRPPGRTQDALCIGKGWRPADALRRCLGELAEYRSWLARGDEPVRVAPDGGAGRPMLRPDDLLTFAPEQRELREPLNAAWGAYAEVAEPWQGQPLAWCELSDMIDGGQVMAPASLCYGHAPPSWSGGVRGLKGDSNGCAAGRDRIGAEAAALLEVVERDAAAIWWYGRCARPALELSARAGPELAAALAERRGRRRSTWLLDLTHDLDIPVVAAVSLDPARGLPAIGLGAASAIARAAEAAFLELCQSELSLSLALRRRSEGRLGAAPAEDRAQRAWLALATPGRLAWLRPVGRRVVELPAAPSSAASDRRRCLAALQAAGLRAYALDLTRADVGVAAVKVIVPGACTLKPRLGASRLVTVPEALRWKPQGLSSADLQALPFPA
jgi:ribosomal protein S12 methylthiotransferase accessory factor